MLCIIRGKKVKEAVHWWRAMSSSDVMLTWMLDSIRLSDSSLCGWEICLAALGESFQLRDAVMNGPAWNRLVSLCHLYDIKHTKTALWLSGSAASTKHLDEDPETHHKLHSVCWKYVNITKFKVQSLQHYVFRGITCKPAWRGWSSTPLWAVHN